MKNKFKHQYYVNHLILITENLLYTNVRLNFETKYICIFCETKTFFRSFVINDEINEIDSLILDAFGTFYKSIQ